MFRGFSISLFLPSLPLSISLSDSDQRDRRRRRHSSSSAEDDKDERREVRRRRDREERSDTRKVCSLVAQFIILRTLLSPPTHPHPHHPTIPPTHPHPSIPSHLHPPSHPLTQHLHPTHSPPTPSTPPTHPHTLHPTHSTFHLASGQAYKNCLRTFQSTQVLSCVLVCKLPPLLNL